MTEKIRVGILFGGKSAEHEVALQSAKNIVEAIDKNKYEVVLIGLDQQGRWLLSEQGSFLLNEQDPKQISLNPAGSNVALVIGADGRHGLVDINSKEPRGSLDVIFPVLHGPFGEDGTIQGLLKLMDVPFVGASVLGSAVGMDKDVSKRLLRDAGLPVGAFLVFHKYGSGAIDFDAVQQKLGLPVFVKPANLGSSVGISKVHNKEQFAGAVEKAFEYDVKIIIEKGLAVREIECSALGNEEPIISFPGEIVPTHDFYSYEAKYIDESGAALVIPANLPEQIVEEIQRLARRAFQALCCEGMARIDVFLTENNEIFINEINTIPGFTQISMFPKLWELSGVSQTELIDRLLQLAIQRYEREKKLKTIF